MIIPILRIAGVTYTMITVCMWCVYVCGCVCVCHGVHVQQERQETVCPANLEKSRAPARQQQIKKQAY